MKYFVTGNAKARREHGDAPRSLAAGFRETIPVL